MIKTGDLVECPTLVWKSLQLSVYKNKLNFSTKDLTDDSLIITKNFIKGRVYLVLGVIPVIDYDVMSLVKVKVGEDGEPVFISKSGNITNLIKIKINEPEDPILIASVFLKKVS